MLPNKQERAFQQRSLWSRALALCIVLSLAACSSGPEVKEQPAVGKIVCDSYIILRMCVRDLLDDGVVDMIYFTDTDEIFMYRDGMKETVGEVMPFHQCAVALSPAMQATTNRLLNRDNLSLSQELAVTRALIANYMDAKPEIDACNARFEGEDKAGPKIEEEFFVEEAEWEDLDASEPVQGVPEEPAGSEAP